MNIALVNLMTKTADLSAGNIHSTPVPKSDENLNIVRQAKQIAANGHSVTVIVADAYEPEIKCSLKGVSIEYVPTKLKTIFPPAVFPYTPELKKYLSHGDFDVIQSGEVFQLGTYLSYASIKNAPSRFFIWQELDILMRGAAGIAQKQFYNTLGKRIAKSCTIIPRSRSAANHLIMSGFKKGNLSGVVHSGTDCSVFRPMNKERCREKFGLDAESDIAISVGRFHRNKGMDIAIQTAALMKKRNPDFKLILKGSGPEEEYLKNLVHHLRLDDSVLFYTEYLNDNEMAELYNCADIYLLTSRNDLFPFTAIEAISCGVPIVSSFGRGIKSDILDEGGGISAPSAPETLSEFSLSLLSDTNLLQSMSSNARKLALDEFDFSVSAERLCNIYEGVQ